MRVLLFDLDIITRRRPFPNLALMKLSAYHKARGDEVFLNFPLCGPDVSYLSCVFTWNAKLIKGLGPSFVIGGSGIDLRAQLPPEVEHIKPDYTLYPNVHFSMGFTSRGCPRRCPWCIVPEKEGIIKPWARIYEFWDRHHGKIVLLDNNFLASPTWRETMGDLLTEGIEVDFNQGLDIRLVNEDNIKYLKRLKAKQFRFAFDDMLYVNALRKGLALMINTGINPRKLSFYVLVGYPGDETALERMEILKSYNVDIYPMLYRNEEGIMPPLDQTRFSLEDYHGSRPNLRKLQRLISQSPYRNHPLQVS